MSAGVGPGSYPSTPHLPFSPQVAADDTQLHAAACSALLGCPVVVTEKVDGGNCCIHRGAVYARTHKHPAAHPSFGPIKALAATLVRRATGGSPPRMRIWREGGREGGGRLSM